ncbi:hypothetical protein [Bradyrhizobium sp.]|uniref:hypothetical protein n=1 Tax=Bradyrhizobium sp. TaxID=376 RepID=UPI0039E52447
MTLFKTIQTSAIILFSAGAALAQQASPPVATPGGVAAAASVGAAAPPRCDANCVRSNALLATQSCVPQIAAQSPADFDWNSRPTQGIFQNADPSSPADAVVRYRGDAVRFVNSQKAWVRLSYECAYDVEARAVVAVNVRAGQLDQPPVSTTAPNNTDAAAASPPNLSSRALAQAIQQAAAQPAQIQQAPRKKPRVWEPSRVEIQQQPPNPRQ